MKTSMIGLALLALAPTAAWADFNIDGFAAGMTKTEVLAKLPAGSVRALDDQTLDADPYIFSFCKNGRLSSLSKKITVKEFNTKLVETIGLRGEPRVSVPGDATMDILSLNWGDTNTNDWMAFSVMGSNHNGYEGGHAWSATDNSFCGK
jgi:hypothetical protein